MTVSGSAIVAELVDATSGDELELKDRLTQELVFAFVGPVGAGVTTTAEIVTSTLRETFAYEVQEWHVSDIIRDSAELVGVAPQADLPRDQKIESYQKLGTALRKKFGEPYLADKCIERIAVDRLDHGGLSPEDEGGTSHALSRRRVHIIDSIKHPAELARLREVYGDTLWTFGIFAPETRRKERMMAMRLDAVQVEKIFRIR